MLVSCKVSYSALVLLERQGTQLDAFFEKQDQPVEFLKDPSYWLPIEQLESFLEGLTTYLEVDDSEAFIREVGHQNFDLRAWGVLDSVLKMVESPNDIFSQPERFLSYFMSPPPAVKVINARENQIQFELKIEGNPYPLVMSYLIGAVEGLPKYMSQPPAQIENKGSLFTLSWTDNQESLLEGEEKLRRQFNPEMVKSVMDSLQQHQRKIEQQNRRSAKDAPVILQDTDIEKRIEEEVERRMAQWLEQRQLYMDTLFQVKNDFYKVYDYFVRAQQLITLISSTARRASVKEAMRRVDWSFVQNEFPKVIERACDSLLNLKESFKKLEGPETPVRIEPRQPVNLNDFIDDIIENLQLGTRQLKIDKHWLLDRDIAVEPENFAAALREILQTSVSHSKNGDEVRIVTRPNGRKAEIEITDTGQGFDEETLLNIFSDNSELNLSASQKIIRSHEGNISISSRQGEGATFLIELPL